MHTEYEINVQIDIETADDLPIPRLKAAAVYTLRSQQIPAGTELSIVITDDAAIQALNRQFRAVDAPTDVLSFPSEPIPSPEDEMEQDQYLGDLVLALPYIQRQAEAEDHTLSDELTLAVVHGTLHLLGYDHDTATHQAAMWSTQASLLRALDVSISVPEFEFDEEEED